MNLLPIWESQLELALFDADDLAGVLAVVVIDSPSRR